MKWLARSLVRRVITITLIAFLAGYVVAGSVGSVASGASSFLSDASRMLGVSGFLDSIDAAVSDEAGGEDVEPVWEGQVTEKGDAQIREEIFQFLNRDDRPNGRFAPSLSVGDVVTIAGGTIEAVSFQVATVGWTHLERPVHADPKAVEAMKERLADRPQTVALNT